MYLLETKHGYYYLWDILYSFATPNEDPRIVHGEGIHPSLLLLQLLLL